MTQQELAAAIYAANEIGLQWYAATHQTAIPGTPGSVVVTQPAGGGFSASFGSGTLLLAAAVIIAAVLLLKK